MGRLPPASSPSTPPPPVITAVAASPAPGPDGTWPVPTVTQPVGAESRHSTGPDAQAHPTAATTTPRLCSRENTARGDPAPPFPSGSSQPALAQSAPRCCRGGAQEASPSKMGSRMGALSWSRVPPGWDRKTCVFDIGSGGLRPSGNSVSTGLVPPPLGSPSPGVGPCTLCISTRCAPSPVLYLPWGRGTGGGAPLTHAARLCSVQSGWALLRDCLPFSCALQTTGPGGTAARGYVSWRP